MIESKLKKQILLICGLFGAGKTTLIKWIISSKFGKRCAII